MRWFLRPALAGLVVAAITSACGKDSVGPKSLADPQATTAQLASLDAILNVNVLSSFSAVSASIQPTGAAPLPALALSRALLPLTQSGGDLQAYARRIEGARIFARLIPQMSVSAVAALFPTEVVGKTFEWDFATNQYAATARTGAPSNGVRFILYAIDQLTGSPANPAVEVGYIDLKDETSSSPKLHVTVAGVGGAPVYVDYTVTLASQGQTSLRITTGGYITNGASSPDSIRFNGVITASGSQTSVSVTEDVSFDVNSHDIHARSWERVTLTQSSAGLKLSLKISFRFEHAGEVVTLDGTLNVDEADGSIHGTITSRVDGGLFATCTADGTSTSYSLTCTGGDQDGLNADEQEALHALGDAVESIGSFFERLLTPALGVLGA